MSLLTIPITIFTRIILPKCWLGVIFFLVYSGTANWLLTIIKFGFYIPIQPDIMLAIIGGFMIGLFQMQILPPLIKALKRRKW